MSDFFGKRTKVKSLYFILKNVDIAEIDRLYNMEILKIQNEPIIESKAIFNPNICEFTSDNAEIELDQSVICSTKIDKIGLKDLRHQPITTIVSKEKMKISSFITLQNIDKQNCHKNTRCHGCHREFDSYPLGIPISHSRIKNRDIFIVDGCVCSFNCMLLLMETTPSSLYKDSCWLIPQLYHTIFNQYPQEKIIKSPHWKLRECYGGILNDQEYAQSFQTIEYTDTHSIANANNAIIQAHHTWTCRDV